jgi:putative ABC transport system ATP-binding protein
MDAITGEPRAHAAEATHDEATRLRVERLSFSADAGESRVRILDEVSFSVARGELFTVLGPSGSGKSTLLRCIDRLVEPDAGQILLDEQPTTELPVQELRRRVGMVFQTAALFDGTVLDNVLYGPRLVICGRLGPEGLAGKPPRPGEAEQAAALLARVGLPPEFAARPAQDLSGGEAQRVSIARALANDPEVLLLDEPTSALDPTASLHIQSLLKDLAAQGDLTLVFVTHDLDQARELGDHGLLLVEGRVVDAGPLPDFLDHSPAEVTRAFAERRLRNGPATPAKPGSSGGGSPAGAATRSSVDHDAPGRDSS